MQIAGIELRKTELAIPGRSPGIARSFYWSDQKMIYPTEKTESGSAIGIGGGSYTNTFIFRAVMRKTGSVYTLKPAIFIKSAGDRACRTDQGLVLIEPGDRIVTGSGYLPIDPANTGAHIRAYRVSMIKDDHAIVYEEPIGAGDLPYKVITGAAIYHNKDGSHFSGGSL